MCFRSSSRSTPPHWGRLHSPRRSPWRRPLTATRTSPARHGPRPSRPACLPAASRHRPSSSRSKRHQQNCRPTGRPRWRCCHLRRARRTRLGNSPPSRRPCRRAWAPAASTRRRSSSRSTRRQRSRRHPVHRRWRCCRRRKGTRHRPGRKVQRCRCQPAWALAGSRCRDFSSKPRRLVRPALRRWPYSHRRTRRRSCLGAR